MEIVQPFVDAFNQRDSTRSWNGNIARHRVAFPAAGGQPVERDSFLGREGDEEVLRESFTDTWEGVRLAAEELRDLGDRRPYLGRIEGRGRGSGVQRWTTPFGAVFDFRGTQFSRVRSYLDHGEALRAAGLTK